MVTNDWLVQIERWWNKEGRRFPWRDSPTPYNVLISEWLLQRTRADLVEKAFVKIVTLFPTLPDLAHATDRDWTQIKAVIQPLGRLQRLEVLRRAVEELYLRFGDIPNEESSLLSVYGIGPYTARAILVFGYGQRKGLIDPNIVRFLGRLLGLQSTKARPRDDRTMWAYVDKLIQNSSADPRKANWGMLDIGAVICSKKPLCKGCPVEYMCMFREKSKREVSIETA